MDAPFTPNRGGVLYITSICFTLDEDVDFNKPANCSAVIELLRPLIRIEVEGVPIIDTLSPSFCMPGSSPITSKALSTGLSFTRFGMSYCNLPSDTFTSGRSAFTNTSGRSTVMLSFTRMCFFSVAFCPHTGACPARKTINK